MAQTFGGLYIFVVIFLFILAILWFLLPFAIFGTKDRLDALLKEARAIKSEMEIIRAEITGQKRLEEPVQPVAAEDRVRDQQWTKTE